MHVEGAIEGIPFAAEDGFGEGFALDNFAGGTHEDFEEGELDVGEIDEGVVLANGAGGGVEDEVFDDEGGGFGGGWWVRWCGGGWRGCGRGVRGR